MRIAWIGFFGAILAAVITIFPSLRPAGVDRLVDRVADLIAALNGKVIVIGPDGSIAHAEAAVGSGDTVTIRNKDEQPHRLKVPRQGGATGGAEEPEEQVIEPGQVLHLVFAAPGTYIVECLTCQTIAIRITVLRPDEVPAAVADGEAAIEEEGEDEDEGQGDAGVTPSAPGGGTPFPRVISTFVVGVLTTATVDPGTSPSPQAPREAPGEPTDPRRMVTPSDVPPPSSTPYGGVSIATTAPTAWPSAEATRGPVAVEPSPGPSEPTAPAPEPTQPVQPTEPARVEPSPSAAKVCPRLASIVPQGDIQQALENPEAVAGWDQLLNPNAPEGPNNPRKHWLSILDVNKPYDRLYNGLRFKAGCP